MKEQYSTQQLNQNLPEVLEQISQGNSVEITQAGELVAVILSASEYQRLTVSKSTFWIATRVLYP
ncbi:MAG: type II toxin-antitoxin system prevent-host-death family antitoxin [Cyanobacteria bacterium P01_A01_bin.40]